MPEIRVPPQNYTTFPSVNSVSSAEKVWRLNYASLTNQSTQSPSRASVSSMAVDVGSCGHGL